MKQLVGEGANAGGLEARGPRTEQIKKSGPYFRSRFSIEEEERRSFWLFYLDLEDGRFLGAEFCMDINIHTGRNFR